MTNADPENEVGDRPTPIDGIGKAPSAYAGGNQIEEAYADETGHAQRYDEAPPPPSGRFGLNDTADFVRDPAVAALV